MDNQKILYRKFYLCSICEHNVFLLDIRSAINHNHRWHNGKARFIEMIELED